MLRVGLRFVVLLICISTSFASFNKVELVDNSYTGVVVAINPEVHEDEGIINSLKSMLVEASDVLWTATRHRAYLGDVTILVPNTWTNGNYTTARGQVYDAADVLVAKANPEYGETPYTLQYGQCGEPGSYIHLTPQYLKDDTFINDFGPRGKVFVHEWAHLRWGVYDESPKEGYDSFYYDSKQKVQATRCPIGLTGDHIYVDDKGNKRFCQLNQAGLPEDGCKFYPHYSQSITSSLLSHHFVDEVIHFCDDAVDLSDTNGHNIEAPNEHNRLCDRKSTWGVIKQSTDFNNTNHPNPNLQPPAPTIKVVKAVKNPKFVLVLDDSGSMSGSRIEELKVAASLFICQFLSNGSKAGIVKFTSYAYNLTELVLIDDNRDYLESVLSTLQASGGTCIGCGIQMGIEMLENDGIAAGGHLLVLSDGQEGSYYPMVAQMANEVLAKGVVIDSIFFGGQNNIVINEALQNISEDSGGVWFFNEDYDLVALAETFKSLSSTGDGDVYNENFQIFSTSKTIEDQSIEKLDIYIDSTIGNNTVFTFTWSQYDAPLITLFEPSGGKHCSVFSSNCASIADVDIPLKLVTFSIPGTAEVGSWVVQIETGSYTQKVDVIVTSMASDRDVEPIVVTSGMSEINAMNLEPIVVYAKVSMGYNPVLGAQVIATITLPNGTKSELELFDAGAAPDVRKYDGVYSRYFTTYFQTGRYAVQVKVKGIGNITVISTHKQGSSAAYNPGYIDKDGTLQVNPKGPTLPGLNSGENGVSTSDLDPFTRVVSPGGFSYQGAVVDPSVDVLPPGKVIDLVAKQVDVTDLSRGVRLTFSAPGDDYDTGRAKLYEIRYSYDGTKQLSDYFESCILVTKDMLIEGGIHNPAEAGTEESLVVSLIKIPDGDTVSIWFALRAYDDAHQASPTSNIAMMNVFIEPYSNSTANTTTDAPATDDDAVLSPLEELEEQLWMFQIITIAVSSVCIILACALIGTSVSNCRMNKQRKKYLSRMDEKLEMAQTNLGSNFEAHIMRPSVSLGSGNLNSYFSK